MSEVKHTPGPWVIDGPKQMTISCRVHRVVNSDMFPSAFVPAWDRPADGEEDGTEEAIANAHLIASAPELLIVAKLLHAEGLTGKYEPAVRTVIDKAEGRS